MPLALIAIFVGYTLIYEAIHKETPWSEILAAFGNVKTYMSGADAPGKPGIPPGGGGGGGGGIGQVTPACNEFQAAVRQRWNSAELSWRGDYVCKCIKGTCIPSQHSWGNAVDYLCATQAIQDAFVEWVAFNKETLHVANAIYHEPGWLYTHTDFNPPGTGEPPCFAGGRPSSCVGC
jgi:hypothetical protein